MAVLTCSGGCGRDIATHGDAYTCHTCRCERDNAPEFYDLPDGWTWAKVARERDRWDIDPRRFPLAAGPNVVAWGVPLPADFA